MLSRGNLATPERRVEHKYVYVKMLQDQADSQEGKVQKGQVLVLPEDKASRWCYRARIARPATREEYERFQAKYMSASRSGQGFRRRRGRVMNIPEENPFEYVPSDSSEWENAEADNDEANPEDRGEVRLVGAGGRGDNTESNLSQRLGSLNQATAQNDTDDDDDDDTSDSSDDDDDEPQPGVFNQAITSGPGMNPEPAGGRPRARARRGVQSNGSDNE